MTTSGCHINHGLSCQLPDGVGPTTTIRNVPKVEDQKRIAVPRLPKEWVQSNRMCLAPIHTRRRRPRKAESVFGVSDSPDDSAIRAATSGTVR
jgi:hypothetical protein